MESVCEWKESVCEWKESEGGRLSSQGAAEGKDVRLLVSSARTITGFSVLAK